MKTIKFIALSFLLSTCNKPQTQVSNPINCSERFFGQTIGSDPVGVWKYYDDKGNVVLKVDYQTNLLDTFKIQSLRKYFSSNGNLIAMEGYLDEKNSIDFRSQDSSVINSNELGRVLVEEYCYSCHRIDTRHIATKLREYNFSEHALEKVLRDGSHSLQGDNLIWENKRNLLFLSEYQLRAIENYVDSSPVIAR